MFKIYLGLMKSFIMWYNFK